MILCKKNLFAKHSSGRKSSSWQVTIFPLILLCQTVEFANLLYFILLAKLISLFHTHSLLLFPKIFLDYPEILSSFRFFTTCASTKIAYLSTMVYIGIGIYREIRIFAISGRNFLNFIKHHYIVLILMKSTDFSGFQIHVYCGK